MSRIQSPEKTNETKALRKIVAAVSDALADGTSIQETAEMFSMECVPRRVSYLVKALREKLETQRQSIVRLQELLKPLGGHDAGTVMREVQKQRTRAAYGCELRDAAKALAASLQECAPEPMDMADLGPMQRRRAAAIEQWHELDKRIKAGGTEL